MTRPKQWGGGDYVVAVLMFPLQLLGVVMLVVGVVGLVYLWRIPSLAREQNLDLTFVLLRTLDQHRLDPLYYLPTDNPERDGDDLKLIEVRFPENARFETVQVGPHRYEHRLVASADSAGGQEPVVTSTTPHTNIPPDQLAKAREMLEKVYPVEDEQAWKELRAWGKGLFLLWWTAQNDRLEPGTEIISGEGTEEEHLWFAWFRLRAGSGRAEEDFPQLGKLAERAYPEKADYASAMAWARTYRDRLALIPSITLREPYPDVQDQALIDRIEVTAPPATDWTSWWLLYQHVGLNEPSRKRARDRWLGFFLAGKADDVLAWGKRLESERRTANEPLPPSSDVVALLCAFERLRGTDDYGVRCRKLPSDALQANSKRSALLQQSLIYGFFPNDDIYYVGASDDRLDLFPVKGASRVALMMLVLLGVRSLVFGLLAQLILRLGNDPLYLRFREKRKLFSAGGILSLLIFLSLPLLAWRLALVALPDWLQLLLTPNELLVEVYISVIFAGGIFLCFTQLLAVILIFFGIDPEKNWLDEIISIPLAVWVLWHFGNEPWSIGSYLAMALIPEVILRTGLIGPADDRSPSQSGGWLTPFMRVGVGAAALCGVVYAFNHLPGCSQPSNDTPQLAGDPSAGVSVAEMLSYPGHPGGTWSVVVTPQERFVSVGEDGHVRMWSYGDDRQAGGFRAGEHPLRAVRVVPDSQLLVVAGSEGVVRLWDPGKRTSPGLFEAEPSPVLALEFSPDGKHLTAGCADGGIRLWSVADRKLLSILEGHTGPVRSLSFSAAGVLASAGEDGTVRLWDVAEQKETHKLDAHEVGAYCVRFSPDGKTLATGGKDEMIRLWDVAMMKEKAKLVGHQGPVLSLAFLDGGTNLVSGGEDSTLRAWHVPTARELGQGTTPFGAIRDLGLYMEGVFVLTANARGQMGLWRVMGLPKG